MRHRIQLRVTLVTHMPMLCSPMQPHGNNQCRASQSILNSASQLSHQRNSQFSPLRLQFGTLETATALVVPTQHLRDMRGYRYDSCCCLRCSIPLQCGNVSVATSCVLTRCQYCCQGGCHCLIPQQYHGFGIALLLPHQKGNQSLRTYDCCCCC